MLATLALAAVALAALLFGSDLTVNGARAIARRLGVSPLIIGLTLTSIGTSLPEIATNVAVGLSGESTGMGVGNVVGSCLSQITLLIGIVALVRPLSVPTGTLRRDGVMLLAALMLMGIAASDGEVSRIEGGLLIGSYVLYLGALGLTARRQSTATLGAGIAPIELPVMDPAGDTTEDTESEVTAERPLWQSFLQAVAGMVLVVFSADTLVGQGVDIARATGLSDNVIGQLVGLGTGLPELMVSLRAVRKGETALSLGNLIGSNITDPLLSLGAGASFHTLTVAPEVLRFDMPFWLFCTVAALVFMRDQRDLNRNEATVLVLMFGLFVYLRIAVVGI